MLLGLHLSHGFWSAFQTVGLNGRKWIGRFEVVSKIYAVVVALGFALMPIYFVVVG